MISLSILNTWFLDSVYIYIYPALLQRIEHCSTRKSTGRLPIYLYIYIYIYINIMRGKNEATTYPNKPVSWIASLFRGLIKFNLTVKGKKALRWLIYVFNPVDNTKLPALLSHWRSTTVSLETYPFIYKYIYTHTYAIRRSCMLITSGSQRVNCNFYCI